MIRSLVLGGVAVAAVAVGLVALAPAGLVTARLAAAPGVRIGAVEGTAWRGRAAALSAGPVVLGSTRWRLGLLPLMGGRTDLALETERMGAIRLRRAAGVSRLDAGRLSAPVSAPGWGAAEVIVTDAALAIGENGACRLARGQVTATPRGEAALVGELTGPLTCRDGRLVADLEGGPVRAVWEADGRAGTWRLAARWTTADPVALNALAAEGFARTPDGAERVWSGRLNPPS